MALIASRNAQVEGRKFRNENMADRIFESKDTVQVRRRRRRRNRFPVYYGVTAACLIGSARAVIPLSTTEKWVQPFPIRHFDRYKIPHTRHLVLLRGGGKRNAKKKEKRSSEDTIEVLSSPFLDSFQEEVHAMVASYRAEVRRTFRKLRKQMELSAAINKEKEDAALKEGMVETEVADAEVSLQLKESAVVDESGNILELEEELEEDFDGFVNGDTDEEEAIVLDHLEEAGENGDASENESKDAYDENSLSSDSATMVGKGGDTLSSLSRQLEVGRNLFVAFSFAVIYLLTRLVVKLVLNLIGKTKGK